MLAGIFCLLTLTAVAAAQDHSPTAVRNAVREYRQQHEGRYRARLCAIAFAAERRQRYSQHRAQRRRDQQDAGAARISHAEAGCRRRSACRLWGTERSRRETHIAFLRSLRRPAGRQSAVGQRSMAAGAKGWPGGWQNNSAGYVESSARILSGASMRARPAMTKRRSRQC